MRKFIGSFMLLGLFALLPQMVSAAVTITKTGDGEVTVHADSYNDFNNYNLTDAEKTLITSCGTLVLTGYFNESDLRQFRDRGLATASVVDFSDAYFEDKSDWSWDQEKQQSVEKKVSVMTFEYWGSNLKKAIMSNHATSFGSSCFQNCSNLEEITVSTSITSLPSGAFRDRSSLKSVVFASPSSITEIPSDCFQRSGITSITIPSTVTTLGTGAFDNCMSLSSVTFEEPSQIETIPSNCFKKTALTSITIPSSVKTIEGQAFEDISALKTVTIPSNSQLETIKNQAFNNCKNITDVYVNVNKQITCEKGAFDNDITAGQTSVQALRTIAKLHYPAEYYDFYVGAWKEELFIDQAGLNTIMNTKSENGWQQFAASGIVFIEFASGQCFQTYSDTLAHKIPVRSVDRNGNEISEQHIFAYLVTGFSNNTVTLKSIPVIPANTGVLLYSKEIGIAYMKDIVDKESEYNTKKYDQFGNKYVEGGTEYDNYLEPI
ncbi:MAG: leucine-rich repeat domain-containing protein, partial [Prevotella sp.]|nr:leucine-rich repeat domain-containing protein [Prevotella sp.]